MNDLTRDILNYSSRTSQVVERPGTHRLKVFLTHDLPQPGHGVTLTPPDGEPVIARVLSHAGGQHVIAALLSARPDILPGTPAVALAQPVGFAPMAGDTLDLSSAAYYAGENALLLEVQDIPFEAYQPERLPITTGLESLDLLTPLCAHGVNLIVDASKGGEAMGRLVERSAGALRPGALVVMGEHIESAHVTHRVRRAAHESGLTPALGASIALARRLQAEHEHIVVVLALPPLAVDHTRWPEVHEQSGEEVRYGDMVGWLGEQLPSLRSGGLTLFLHLPVDASAAGAQEYIDTMRLGEVDAQIFVTASATYDPARSRSRAEHAVSERAALAHRTHERIITELHRMESLSMIFDKDDLDGEELFGPDEELAAYEIPIT